MSTPYLESPAIANGNSRPQSKSNKRRAPPSLGPGDRIGAGDSYLLPDLLPPDLREIAFERLRNEVDWGVMRHRGGDVPRLVAVEGEVGKDGSYPVYRHPADESPALRPFTKTVSMIRDYVEKAINHPVNHVLIQHYRSGADYISEHSDKTIDVVQGSTIVNVSLGAQRVMTLRLKKGFKKNTPPEASAELETRVVEENSGGPGTPREAQRVPLPHNSLFVLGPETNKQWLHAIGHDNRPFSTKSLEEQREGGGRISLTFRWIGTFLSADGEYIWGQGAKGKTKEQAAKVVNGGEEAEKLIIAFGDENKSGEFVWEEGYGQGFDVLHFTT